MIKNDIIFFYGLRRMMLAVWVYEIPPLYFLKNEPKPIEKKVIYFEPAKVFKEEFVTQKNNNQLF